MTTTRLLSLAAGGLLAVVLTVYLTSPATPAVVGRDDAAAAQMLALVNAERSEHGLGALRPAEDVAAVAAAWSARMAEIRELAHNPASGDEICCWTRVTENVAWSQPPRTRLAGDPTATVVMELHDALLASPGHRRNLLDPGVDEIGIGVHVTDDGSVWITQNFRAARARAH